VGQAVLQLRVATKGVAMRLGWAGRPSEATRTLTSEQPVAKGSEPTLGYLNGFSSPGRGSESEPEAAVRVRGGFNFQLAAAAVENFEKLKNGEKEVRYR
jgi:hypothetical protein